MGGILSKCPGSICKRPSVRYNPETFAFDGTNIRGDIQYRLGGADRSVEFDFEFPLLDGAIEVQLADYPNREIRTVDPEGNCVRRLPVYVLSMGLGLHRYNEELANLEVLYVGQAFGDGERSAFDRLRSHSTFQKILADAQYSDPDCELSVMAFEYDNHQLIAVFDGINPAKISDYRDIDRFYSILQNPLTEHQLVCLVEAGLIRYFKPHYNKIFRESFPDHSHKILAGCYSLDFSGLIVEIDTSELCFNLYSDGVAASEHHIGQFNLVAHQDRWSFFHYASHDGTAQTFPGVIGSK